MENSDQLKFFLSQFVTQLPVLFVCLIAGVMLLVKWKQASPGSLWAMLGFGLTLILCIIIPIVQAAVQNWILQNGGPLSQRMTVLSGFSFLWSLLRAVGYALILAGVLAGRPAPRPAPLPSPLSYPPYPPQS
jgi:hypothetical protein